MDKLLSEITTWYWWLSVVVVGVAVNLLSSYAKPHIDKWIDRRSERSRVKREKTNAEFEAKVNKLSSNPNLLIIEGQKLQELHHITLGATLMLGLLFSLNLYLSQPPSPSLLRSFFQLAIISAMAINLLALIIAIRRESEMELIINSARKNYHKAA